MDFETETFVAAPLTQNYYADNESRESLLIAHCLRGGGFDASDDGTGRGTPIVPVAIQAGALRENPASGPEGVGVQEDIAYTLEARAEVQAVAAPMNAGYGTREYSPDETYVADVAPCLTQNYGRQPDNSDTSSGPLLVAFDTTQISSKTNRYNPQPGDPCHPLAPTAHPPAIAYRTAGDGAVTEEGDSISPLTTATDPNANIVCFSAKDSGHDAQIDLSPTLRAGGHSTSHANAGVMPAIAYGIDEEQNIGNDIMGCLKSREKGGGFEGSVMHEMAVRRITVVEAARLQGFPDTFTHIEGSTRRKIDADEAEYLMSHGLTCTQQDGQWYTKVSADGPQYKAYGNSQAVPVIRWIGDRIQMVEDLCK